MFHSAHNRLALRIVATLALGGLLAACGYKGPLYLPPPEPGQPAPRGGKRRPSIPCSVPAMTAVSVQPDLAGSPYFRYQNGVLHAEDVPLDSLAAQLGTPLYVYSRAALRSAWETYRDAIGERPVLVCFGMKANSNLAVLKEFARLGAGFDIVSGGELARVLAVGGDPPKVVFSGVGKQAWEMRAALEADVKCFNVESEAELERLSDVAVSMGRRARVSLRVNPDVDAQTHPYISTGLKGKQVRHRHRVRAGGIPAGGSPASVEVVGVDCHIGSQLTDISPYFDALEKLLDLIEQLAENGIAIKHLDLGGGLGIRYTDEIPPSPKALLDRVFERINARGLGHLHIVLEPGRSLVGNAGVLLTTVQYLQARRGAQLRHCRRAAMNDLLRPALYEAYHGVQPVTPRADKADRVRRRRAGLRKRRLAGARPRPGDPGRRRAGGGVGRRLQHGHGQQLQHPGARGRSHGRRQPPLHRAPARNAGVAVPGRVHAALTHPQRPAKDNAPHLRGIVFEGGAGSELAVRVQARQEHVHAQEGETGDQQAHQGPIRRHGAAQALDQAHMEPGGVVQPHDQRPGFAGSHCQ